MASTLQNITVIVECGFREMNALLYALVVVIWGTTWIAISLQQQSI